jgi:hypothetical protein
MVEGRAGTRARACMWCRSQSKKCKWPEHWAEENSIAASTAVAAVAQANNALVKYIVRARPDLLRYRFISRLATDLGYSIM